MGNDDIENFVQVCESLEELFREARRQVQAFEGTVFGTENREVAHMTLDASLLHLGKYAAAGLEALRAMQASHGVEAIGVSASEDMGPGSVQNLRRTSAQGHTPDPEVGLAEA